MMTFSKITEDKEGPRVGSEYYFGWVIENLDPLELGRLKIRIPELHGINGEIPDDHLPWCMYVRPMFMGAMLNRSTFAVPDIDTRMLVVHTRGDVYSPAFVGEPMFETAQIEQQHVNYPESYVIRDRNDDFYHVDMKEKKLHIFFDGDVLHEVTGDYVWKIGGKMAVEVAESVSWKIGEDETREVGGAFDAKVAGDVDWLIGGDETHRVVGDLTFEMMGDFELLAAGEVTLAAAGGLDLDSIDSFVVQPPTLSALSGIGEVGGAARTFSVPVTVESAGAAGAPAAASTFAVAAAVPKPRAKLSVRDGQIRMDTDADLTFAPKGRLRAFSTGAIEFVSESTWYARSAGMMSMRAFGDYQQYVDGAVAFTALKTMDLRSDAKMRVISEAEQEIWGTSIDLTKYVVSGGSYGSVGPALQNHVRAQGRLVQVVA